jgi:hypothetical protein
MKKIFCMAENATDAEKAEAGQLAGLAIRPRWLDAGGR